MKKSTLKQEIIDIYNDWGNLGEEGPKYLINKIMKAINKRANHIDVGERIKLLMWECKGTNTFTYGKIAETIEQLIVKEMK
jgi:hypothetical protein